MYKNNINTLEIELVESMHIVLIEEFRKLRYDNLMDSLEIISSTMNISLWEDINER